MRGLVVLSNRCPTALVRLRRDWMLQRTHATATTIFMTHGLRCHRTGAKGFRPAQPSRTIGSYNDALALQGALWCNPQRTVSIISV
jgi:hypothetical protein